MPFASNFGFFKDAVDEGDARFINSFQISIKTDNPGVSNNDQVKLPIQGGPYLISWGDGSTETVTQNTTAPSAGGGITHTYPSAGTYTVKISPDNVTGGTFSYYNIGSTQDPEKLLTHIAWGTVPFNNTLQMFEGCSNLTAISSVDSRPTSYGTSMLGMFKDCSSLSNGGSINSWDISSVTNVSSMFHGATLFNSSLNSWNTSNVTIFGSMFLNASAFNGNCTSWNMNSATDLVGMFQNATSFNQDIGSWQFLDSSTFPPGTSGGIIRMFAGATSFNQDIGSWNTLNLQGPAPVDGGGGMVSTFDGATAFFQDLSGWCVNRIPNKPTNFDRGTSMSFAFTPVWGTCP